MTTKKKMPEPTSIETAAIDRIIDLGEIVSDHTARDWASGVTKMCTPYSLIPAHNVKQINAYDIRNTLIKRLTDYHEVQVEAKGFTTKTKLEYDLGLTDFDVQEFIHWAEKKFNIDISYAEMAKIKTFGQLCRTIECKTR